MVPAGWAGDGCKGNGFARLSGAFAGINLGKPLATPALLSALERSSDLRGEWLGGVAVDQLHGLAAIGQVSGVRKVSLAKQLADAGDDLGHSGHMHAIAGANFTVKQILLEVVSENPSLLSGHRAYD